MAAVDVLWVVVVLGVVVVVVVDLVAVVVVVIKGAGVVAGANRVQLQNIFLLVKPTIHLKSEEYLTVA